MGYGLCEKIIKDEIATTDIVSLAKTGERFVEIKRLEEKRLDYGTASTNSITISTEWEESVIIERRYKTILV